MALLSWKGFKQASSDHQSMIFKMALHLPLQFSLRCVQTILTQAGVFTALSCVLLGAHIKMLPLSLLGITKSKFLCRLLLLLEKIY